MRENVFEVLGMENTDYLRSERVREGLAQGYNFSRGRLKPVKYLEIVVLGVRARSSRASRTCVATWPPCSEVARTSTTG
jgi:CubicO group peptidase (beta-lactamase class C family)